MSITKCQNFHFPIYRLIIFNLNWKKALTLVTPCLTTLSPMTPTDLHRPTPYPGLMKSKKRPRRLPWWLPSPFWTLTGNTRAKTTNPWSSLWSPPIPKRLSRLLVALVMSKTWLFAMWAWNPWTMTRTWTSWKSGRTRSGPAREPMVFLSPFGPVHPHKEPLLALLWTRQKLNKPYLFL